MRRIGEVARSSADVARSRAHVPLWLSQLASNFGDTVHHIALVVLLFDLTGSDIEVTRRSPSWSCRCCWP